MNARRNGWLFCDPSAETVGGFPLETVTGTYRVAGREVPRRLAHALLKSQADTPDPTGAPT